MKRILIFISLAFCANLLFSQVGGISASKLATICANPVPNKVIEFEPSFGFGYSEKYFDDNSKLTNTFVTKDSIEVFSDFGFR